jgi:hypothetical protein
MANKIKTLIWLLAGVMFASCSEKYLDADSTHYISNEQLEQMAESNPAKALEPLVAGLYYNTFAMKTGGSTRPDDFGQKAVDISLDLMSCDMSVAMVHAWFLGVYNYTHQVRTGINADIVWRYYYKIVRGSNEILDIIGSDEEMPQDPIARACFGQAKSMRAYAYFYLVNLYQHPYSDKKDAPGVPVYRTQKEMSPHVQSTVKEVYELIISDLEDAIIALEGLERGDNKSKIDQYVALGLLANAYLMRGETGDYQKAADAAGKVIDSGKFPLMTADEVINSGFNSINLNSWIWGMDLTSDNNTADYTFWSHVDYYTFGYTYRGVIKGIDIDLYSAIPTSDVRKNQFGSPQSDVVGELPLAPFRKFYNASRKQGGQIIVTDDIVYMRAEEMVLIQAEALARLGNIPASLKSLKSLTSLRDPATNLENLSNDELLETIWLNWRVEMWGEGRTYFAMKRFKKTMHRAENHVYHAGESFPYNYERMIYAIPESEHINNHYLVNQQ